MARANAMHYDFLARSGSLAILVTRTPIVFCWGMRGYNLDHKASKYLPMPGPCPNKVLSGFWRFWTDRSSRQGASANGAEISRTQERQHQQHGAQGAVHGKQSSRPMGTKRKSVVIGLVGAYQGRVHGLLKPPAFDVVAAVSGPRTNRKAGGPRNPCFGRTMEKR